MKVFISLPMHGKTEMAVKEDLQKHQQQVFIPGDQYAQWLSGLRSQSRHGAPPSFPCFFILFYRTIRKIPDHIGLLFGENDKKTA